VLPGGVLTVDWAKLKMEWSDEARRLHAESFSVRAEEVGKRAEEAQRVYVRETDLESKREEEEEEEERVKREEEVKVELSAERSEESVLVEIDGRVVKTQRRVFDREPQSVFSEQLRGTGENSSSSRSLSVVMSWRTWAIVHEWLNRLVDLSVCVERGEGADCIE